MLNQNQNKITLTLLISIGLLVAATWLSCRGPEIKIAAPRLESAASNHLPVNQDKKIIAVADRVRLIARENNFKWPEYLIKLSFCESSHRPEITGDNGNSRGLFQISRIYHPEVSDACAYDIVCATKWTINQINAGRQGMWSCNKIILAKK